MTNQEHHVITVTPAVNRPGRFEARLDDELLCTSRQPLLDSARILAGRGVDPSTTLAMRHAGDDFDSLTATIGVAARLTVEDGRWKAFSRAVAEPPMRFPPDAATSTPDAPENAPATVCATEDEARAK